MRWTRGRGRVTDPEKPLELSLFSLNYWPETTGIGPYAHDLATGLQSRGMDIQVVTAYPHYPEWRVQAGYSGLRTSELAEGVRVVRLRHYVPRRPTSLKRAISELVFGVRLALTRWRSPDVVLLMSPAMLSSAVALVTRGVRRRRAAVGVVVQDIYSSGVRELTGGGGLMTGLICRAETKLLRSADGVAIIHERFRGQVEAMGVEPDRIRVLRNWSKSEPSAAVGNREHWRSELGWRPDEVVVLHAGAMGVKQGLENVIDAARLADRGSTPVRFVLLGDGSRRRDLEDAARGVSAVDFLDPLPEETFQAALRCADLLLINELPDLEQTAVPSKLSSYLASGTPVVAAVRPGSVTEDEVLASGGGVCVPAGVPDELLAAVVLLSADPAARAELGKRGLAYCTSVLSKRIALQSYADWVHDLESRRR